MITSQPISYHDQNILLQGHYAYDEQIKQLKPIVLVFHDWSGCNDLAKRKAEQLAKLGYVGFAVDMYGQGKTGQTKEEKVALMQPLIQNRQQLQQRALAALQAAQQLPVGDASKIGAIGLCFGGLCALDLARRGANLAGVVSFHGLLHAPEHKETNPIKAKVLVLHGYDDPMVPPESLLHFAHEMNQAQVDWQLQIYGHTQHAFSNPEANDPGLGTIYNKQADTRSWLAMQNFFEEVFRA